MANAEVGLEEWRAIVEAPGYEISDRGRGRRVYGSHSGQGRQPVVLSPEICSGYLRLRFTTCSGKILRFVHEVVCVTFNGPPPSAAHQAAHIDGVRTNNRPANLYWATVLEHVSARERHGATETGDGTREGMRSVRLAQGDTSGRKLRPEPYPPGEVRRGFAKLTPETVLMIRCEPSYRGVGRDLAARFGVSRGLISQIRSGHGWKHVHDLLK